MSQPTISKFSPELPRIPNSVFLDKSKEEWCKELEVFSLKELIVLEDSLRTAMIEVVNNKIDYSERVHKEITASLEEAMEFRKHLLNWDKEFCQDGTLNMK